MKTYDQILEEIAQTESRIKQIKAEIKKCASANIFISDIRIQIFATVLREQTVRLETLNWVINQ